ncbi:MAG: cytochrome c [Gammaproteobacteria bacterium]|nr:cytochrome c [Gammaproteobacteria bacterium]
MTQDADDSDYLSVQTSINALMVALVDHSAHELWAAGSAQTLSAVDWRTVEQHAVQLIGSGTLISLGGTGAADAAWVATPAWQEWSQLMTDGALAALEAVQETDQDALNRAGSVLVESCQGCHEAFISSRSFRPKATLTLPITRRLRGKTSRSGPPWWRSPHSRRYGRSSRKA